MMTSLSTSFHNEPLHLVEPFEDLHKCQDCILISDHLDTSITSCYALGRNVGRLIPLVWRALANLPTVQVSFDFLPVLGHQPLGIPPSNHVDLNNGNMVLGKHIKPPTMRQGIHMTLPHEPCLVCPLSLLVDVEMTLEVPSPPLVVVDDDMVEVLG